MGRTVFKWMTLAVSASTLMLAACSTQGASRYGDVYTGQGAVPCGTVLVPCGQVIEYHRVQVQPPAYLVPAPCPAGQCLPPEPPVVEQPPVIVEPPYVPPVIPEPPYEPPVIVEPPVVEPPILRPSPPPPVSCPPGTIPGYGGTDCIPITVPRK